MSANRIDYILSVEIRGEREEVEELLQGRLFLTSCEGSVSVDRDGSSFLDCYFSDPAARASARQVIESVDGIARIDEDDRQRRDWLADYEESLVARNVGERFIVAPRRDLVTSSHRTPIIIPQERAFGTGTHETTALCLAMLERADCRGKLGLDIGTGSGILAIGMALLGCRKVFGFDNDPEVLGIIDDNLERNGVDAKLVRYFVGDTNAVRRARVDVLTMNILPEVIVPLLPEVKTMMVSGASLILSGILRERSEWVIEECRLVGLALEVDGSDGEWWCGKFTLSS